jgi:hypothetical protein
MVHVFPEKAGLDEFSQPVTPDQLRQEWRG